MPSLPGHHECELLGRGLEAAETESRWHGCGKNPGHEDFISAQDFIDNHLPRVKSEEHRNKLKAAIDLTVRLRIRWTSLERPDGDDLCASRGSDDTRLGTGFIDQAVGPIPKTPCPCKQCDGKTGREFWRFKIRTAQHVVYSTEEARKTRIDLFYDDDSCRCDGMMKTIMGLDVVECKPDRDTFVMWCVTHDEAVGERIQAAWLSWYAQVKTPLNLSDLGLQSPRGKDRCAALVVSHPHGQPKKITLGEARMRDGPLVQYNAATCPGSSGAPVFWGATDPWSGWLYIAWFPLVHSGSSATTSTQVENQLSIVARFLRKLNGRKSKLINYGNKYWNRT